jgi:hypothetical protein
MNYTDTSNLTASHSVWLKLLSFYKEDIDILKNRLLEVAGKNTSAEAMAGVEHFQNQFIVQRNNIDEMNHSINEYAHQLAGEIQQHAGKVSLTIIEKNTKLNDEVKQLEKIINELRQEFNLYLSKWM